MCICVCLDKKQPNPIPMIWWSEASKLDEIIRILLVNQLQCLVVPGYPEAQILEDLPSQGSRKYLFAPNLKIPFVSKSSFEDR